MGKGCHWDLRTASDDRDTKFRVRHQLSNQNPAYQK
jgi:hypothetical protein